MRADRIGAHRANYERNRKRVMRTQSSCGICHRPVDLSLKVPNPMAGVVDHIVPINKGGHPSDISNLQLAHHTCNRQKSDKLFKHEVTEESKVLGNRVLPQSKNWKNYKFSHS